MRLALLLFLIIALHNVKADTSYPIPSSMTLDRGTGREFEFQIQNIRGSNDISCGYAVEESNGLEIIFPEPAVIKAGSRMNIRARVNVPGNLEDGRYTAKFCVHCQPNIEDFGGSSVRQSDCGLPVNVVVGRTEEGKNRRMRLISYISAIAIVLAISLAVLIRRRRR